MEMRKNRNGFNARFRNVNTKIYYGTGNFVIFLLQTCQSNDRIRFISILNKKIHDINKAKCRQYRAILTNVRNIFFNLIDLHKTGDGDNTHIQH